MPIEATGGRGTGEVPIEATGGRGTGEVPIAATPRFSVTPVKTTNNASTNEAK